jgi:hypothetical protein
MPIRIESEVQEAVASWQQYEATGLHVEGEEVAAWLDSWGTESEREALSALAFAAPQPVAQLGPLV